MNKRLNLKEISEAYRVWLENVINTKDPRIHIYDIADWPNILGPRALMVFDDIRGIGLPLYPIYPIDENEYLEFANPFLKVGIEHVYNNSPEEKVAKKIELLEKKGWTIFPIKSQKTYYTFEQFCHFKLVEEGLGRYEDLDNNEKEKFLEDYKFSNTACLLYYLRSNYFFNYEYRVKTILDSLTFKSSFS